MLKKIICFFKGHKTLLRRVIIPNRVEKCKCTRCGQSFYIDIILDETIKATPQIDILYDRIKDAWKVLRGLSDA